MDYPAKNTLTSAQFQIPLPRNPQRIILQKEISKISLYEEAMHSFKIKKNSLLQALQFQKHVTHHSNSVTYFQGNKKEYQSLINKQSFVNTKEEPQDLRIWVKVFLDALSIIIHEYQNHELLELLVFKLPWFTSTTTHGQNFGSFIRLVLAVLSYDVSYLHKVIRHIFSPHGLFQCMVLGEHQPVLIDLLWASTQTIIKECQKVYLEGNSRTTQNAKSAIGELTQEQVESISKHIKDLKTTEDILVKAQNILQEHANQIQTGAIKVQNTVEQVFLKAVFSFHPTRIRPDDPNYPIFIGKCLGFETFFVKSFVSAEGALPDEGDAISVKKCINNIVQDYTLKLKEFAENKYHSTPLKQLGSFLAKLMNLYTFARASIIQNLLEKLPHKNTPVENQYLYYKLVFDIARLCPESEEKILEAVVDKLCQLDVDIKSKIRKFAFSNISKIQPMNSYLKELSAKTPTEKEIKIGLLFNMLLEYILDRTKMQAVQKNQSSFDGFMETLMKIFVNKIFPVHKLNFMQYLPLYAITLSQQNEKYNLFTEKMLSFLIFKAFNCVAKEHLSVRQQSWNYLASLIGRQNSIIKEQTIMKCMSLILECFDSNCKVKTSKINCAHSTASNHISYTETSEIEQLSSLTSQDKIFQHCFIQGLAFIIITKNEVIQRNDPQIFTTLCKYIFKKYFKSLSYCSPLILSDLLKLTESNKHDLGLFKTKVQDVFGHQNKELKSSKRQIYLRVSKYMPYECPLYLQLCNDKMVESLHFEDISSVYINQIGDSQQSKIIESQITVNNAICGFKHEEIDFLSLSQEQEKKLPIISCNKNQTVIYTPDINQLQHNANGQQIMHDSSSEKFNDIDIAIAQSRHVKSLFNFNINYTHNIECKKVTFPSQQQQFDKDQKPFSQLNIIALNEFNNDAPLKQADVISSSKDTEYSVSPYVDGKPKLLAGNRSEKYHKNLKEENDRATTSKKSFN